MFVKKKMLKMKPIFEKAAAAVVCRHDPIVSPPEDDYEELVGGFIERRFLQ
jgi:hypothetical protein